MKQSHAYEVIVIGGGASGMMSAGRAAELGKKVLLLEKNPALGEKLKISGGGRCNITNNEHDIHALLQNYGTAAPFLYSPFSQFGIADTFSFFERLGLPLVVQARNRVFPNTERAIDVFHALQRYLKNGSVTILPRSPVTKILCEKNRIIGVQSRKEIYTAQSYILATGGLSHPETGSTGDGFKWLTALGHTVVKPTPGIVPLATREKWGHALSGVSLSFMKITFFVDGVKSFSKTGKILFTHFGISGPLILNLAKKVGDLMHTGIVTATIDAYPDTDIGALETKIIATFDANKNKMLKNVLDDIVPHGLARAIPTLLPTIDLDTKVHSVSRDDRKLLVRILKALPLTITGLLGFDRAVVADGGIPMNEIDTKTMRSKKIENLFVTGDLLHINRPSGGFSLQLCWTTGFVAGCNA